MTLELYTENIPHGVFFVCKIEYTIYMQIKLFEEQLQKNVDKSINFREHPVNKDTVGIYYGDIYTDTAIPNNEIRENREENYVDNFGFAHRGSIEAEARVRSWLDKYTNDKEFRELYND